MRHRWTIYGFGHMSPMPVAFSNLSFNQDILNELRDHVADADYVYKVEIGSLDDVVDVGKWLAQSGWEHVKTITDPNNRVSYVLAHAFNAYNATRNTNYEIRSDIDEAMKAKTIEDFPT